MPYSFTKIEEDKTRTIGFVFLFLIIFYFVSFLFIYWATKVTFYLLQTDRMYQPMASISLREGLVIFVSAFVVGMGHWFFTSIGMLKKMLRALDAQPLNLEDKYHRQFKNIIDEVVVATGGQKKIEGVIIPSVAMNAFAISDFNGNSYIGVTEGVLARLTRAQIEAIVGHEAAHIMQGDCLAATVTSSLFQIYSALLVGFEGFFRGTSRRSYSSRGRGSGGIIILAVVVYGLLFVTRAFGNMVRMFISREREYRADAIAVRLTRDPLSLAEALYAISYFWRGNGLPAAEMDSIFIVSPKFFDTESALSGIFQTHPPVEKRIDILTDMAHIDIQNMVADVERKSDQPRIDAPSVKTFQDQWVANKDGQWQGPFDFKDMMNLDWVRADTWLQKLTSKDVKKAIQFDEVRQYHDQKQGAESKHSCPNCHIGLSSVNYEGTQTYQCHSCGGRLVHQRDVERILVRTEVGFDGQVKRIAEQIKEKQNKRGPESIKRDPTTLLTCPECANERVKMLRQYYTSAYQVEIDKCTFCGYIWFDEKELEVLQCLIEETMRPNK